MNHKDQDREAILKERARRLAARRKARPEAAPAARADWLIFRRGERTFGLETRLTVEAQPLSELTPIPCTPSFILGVVAVRGRLVAVMDLPLFLDLDAGPTPETPAMVIVRGQGLETSLLADAVLGVQSLPAAEVLPLPGNLPPGLASRCKGVTAQGWLLLDAAGLLADPGLVVEERA